MSKEQTTSVREVLLAQVNQSGRTLDEIANECGWPESTPLRMVLEGVTKLPVSRVEALARTLGINPQALMSAVMGEYMPDTWAALRETFPGLSLSPTELEMVRRVRQHAQTHGEAETVVVEGRRVVAIVTLPEGP